MGHIFKILLFAFLLLSCKEATITNFNTEIPDSKTLKNDSLTNFLLEIGFSSESIVDKGNFFLVEQDMIFKKDVLRFHLDKKKKQRQYRFIVDTSKVQNITINTEDLRDKGSWEVNFMAAVDYWNNVPNSKASFIIDNNTANPSIVIFANELQNLRLEGGKSEVPDSLGNPGKSLTVEYDPELDPKYENSTSPSNERIAIAVHELGHTIGLAHTDSPVTSQVQIRCTPLEDDLSIMDKDILTLLLERPSLTLTFGDKLAIQSLYPEANFELNCNDVEELVAPESPELSATFDSNSSIRLNWTTPESDTPVTNYIMTRYNMGYDGTIKDGQSILSNSNSLTDHPKYAPDFSNFKLNELGFACYSVLAQSIVGKSIPSKIVCLGTGNE